MKERLDLLLVKRGIAPSREKAKTMIMEGCVFVNHQREDKAGSMFAEDCDIEIHGNSLKYVSRGGLKFVWILGRLPEDLQTVCCKTAQKRSMPSTSGMGSLRGNCVATSGSSAWKRRISVMYSLLILQIRLPLHLRTFLLSP